MLEMANTSLSLARLCYGPIEIVFLQSSHSFFLAKLESHVEWISIRSGGLCLVAR